MSVTDLASLTAEERLAVLVARPPSDATREAIERTIAGGPDWEAALALIALHRLRPLAHLRLRDHPTVPAAVRGTLRAAYLRSLAWNTLLLNELGALGDALARAGVPAIALKGPLLSERLYHDIGARETSDLDVLVMPSDLPVVERAVAMVGYRAEPYSLRYRLQHHYHRTYTREAPVGRYALEVHWHVLPPWRPFHLRLDGLWQRGARPTANGAFPADLRVLAPADELLVLLLQLLHHQFALSLWADIAALVTALGPRVDWTALHQEVHTAGAATLLRAASAAAARLLDVGLPVAPAPWHARVVTSLLDPVTIVRRVDDRGRARRTMAMWLCVDSAASAAAHGLRWWARPVEWVAKSRRVAPNSAHAYWSYVLRLAGLPLKAARLLLQHRTANDR